jgi:hypothetical protein
MLGLEEVECKIDTGAQTSAIHCHEIRVYQHEGTEVLSFRLLDPSHPAYNHKQFTYTVFEERVIKNSFGQSEERFVIKTTVRLFGKDYLTEFSLADRVKMKYPVLLGKKLLREGFLVDVTKKNLSFKQKQKALKRLR